MESGDPLACRKIGLFLFSLDLKFGKAIKDDEIVWKPIPVFIHIADKGLPSSLYVLLSNFSQSPHSFLVGFGSFDNENFDK